MRKILYCLSSTSARECRPAKLPCVWTDSAFPVGFAVMAEGIYYGATSAHSRSVVHSFFSFSTGRRNPAAAVSSQAAPVQARNERLARSPYIVFDQYDESGRRSHAGSRLQSVATMTIPLQICGEALHSQIPPESLRRHWDCEHGAIGKLTNSPGRIVGISDRTPDPTFANGTPALQFAEPPIVGNVSYPRLAVHARLKIIFILFPVTCRTARPLTPPPRAIISSRSGPAFTRSGPALFFRMKTPCHQKDNVKQTAATGVSADRKANTGSGAAA